MITYDPKEFKIKTPGGKTLTIRYGNSDQPRVPIRLDENILTGFIGGQISVHNCGEHGGIQKDFTGHISDIKIQKIGHNSILCVKMDWCVKLNREFEHEPHNELLYGLRLKKCKITKQEDEISISQMNPFGGSPIPFNVIHEYNGDFVVLRPPNHPHNIDPYKLPENK